MKIAGKEYKLEYTLRSLIIYEELTGESFTPGLLKNELVLYYAILIANNHSSGFDLSFSGFIDAVETENLLPALREWLIKEAKNSIFTENSDETGDSDKKKE
jgi:hypothetical protein